jgi:hypothetical protein
MAAPAQAVGQSIIDIAKFAPSSSPLTAGPPDTGGPSPARRIDVRISIFPTCNDL